MTEEEFEQYRNKKAIRPDVWASQFERFTTKDRARALYREDELAPNQRNELSKMLNWMGGRMGDEINPNLAASSSIAPRSPVLRRSRPS